MKTTIDQVNSNINNNKKRESGGDSAMDAAATTTENPKEEEEEEETVIVAQPEEEKAQSIPQQPSFFERVTTSVVTAVESVNKKDELDWAASFGDNPALPPEEISSVAAAASSLDDCWACDDPPCATLDDAVTKVFAKIDDAVENVENAENNDDAKEEEEQEEDEKEQVIEQQEEEEEERPQPQPVVLPPPPPPPSKREEEDWEKIVKKRLPPRLVGTLRDPLGPFTVIFFGNKDVGKTTIVSRYTDGGWGGGNRIRAGRPTVCADISTKTVILGDGDAVKLTLWDTAGAEQFKAFLPMYMRKLDAAVLVYAANDAASMHAIGPWHEFVAREAPQCAVWFAVANKIDTVLDGNFKNSQDRLAAQLPMLRDGAELARIYDIPQFKMTNALTGEGVDDLFAQIAVTLRTRQMRLRGLDVKSVNPDSAAQVLKNATRAMAESSSAPPPQSTKIPNKISSSGVIVLRRGEYEDADRLKAEQKEYARLVRREIARRNGLYSFC